MKFAQVSALQAERDQQARQAAELEEQMDRMKPQYEAKIQALEEELDGVLEELRSLQDAKLSMDLELLCYKTLLDFEDTR